MTIYVTVTKALKERRIQINFKGTSFQFVRNYQKAVISGTLEKGLQIKLIKGDELTLPTGTVYALTGKIRYQSKIISVPKTFSGKEAPRFFTQNAPVEASFDKDTGIISFKPFFVNKQNKRVAKKVGPKKYSQKPMDQFNMNPIQLLVKAVADINQLSENLGATLTINEEGKLKGHIDF